MHESGTIRGAAPVGICVRVFIEGDIARAQEAKADDGGGDDAVSV